MPQRLQARSASLLSWPQIKCPLPSGSPTRKLIICPVPSPAHSFSANAWRENQEAPRRVGVPNMDPSWVYTVPGMGEGRRSRVRAGREGLPETSWDHGSAALPLQLRVPLPPPGLSGRPRRHLLRRPRGPAVPRPLLPPGRPGLFHHDLPGARGLEALCHQVGFLGKGAGGSAIRLS